MKTLPARMRQYAAFDYVQKMIKGYLKINVLIIELKSEALKERHWKQLMRKLSVKWSLNDLTLGQVWDCNLQKNEAIVKDIINVAQGEMALEEFLKQVKEAWHQYELELVNYQNRCKLIRGWDELFEKVKEHINSVTAMKLSPYYKVSITIVILSDYTLSFNLIKNFVLQILVLDQTVILAVFYRCLKKMQPNGKIS